MSIKFNKIRNVKSPQSATQQLRIFSAKNMIPHFTLT